MSVTTHETSNVKPDGGLMSRRLNQRLRFSLS